MNDQIPMNSVAWWEQYFQEDWERHGGPAQTRHFMQRLLAALPAADRAVLVEGRLDILDWGCAFGDGTDELARAFPASRLTGLDVAAAAVDAARRRYGSLNFETAGDAAAGELPREFDVVINSNALEHFAHPLEVLRANLARTRLLHLSLVPYREAPLSEHHAVQFDEATFPASLAGFERLWQQVIDVDPAAWPGGKQLLVAYASAAYRARRAEVERSAHEREKWDAYYATLPVYEIDACTQAFNDELVATVRELLPDGGRILEAGCGGGIQSLALAQAGFDVSLLDFSPAALDYARRVFDQHQQRAEFIRGDAFAGGEPRFDLVFNSGVLEHYSLPEQARFLRGMASRSRRYVLVLIPNRGCYWYWLWRMKKAAAGDWPFGKETPQTTLADAFEAAGLAYVGHAYLGSGWSESFIESFAGIDADTRKLLLEAHRSPVLPPISKGYLLAALGAVAPLAQSPLPRWTAAGGTSIEGTRATEEWTALLADALASKIGADQRWQAEVVRLTGELAQREQRLQEAAAQHRQAAEAAAAEHRQAVERLSAQHGQAIDQLTAQHLAEVERLSTQLRATEAQRATENEQAAEQLSAQQAELATVRQDLTAARDLARQLQAQVQQSSNDLHAIYSSRSWRAILLVRAVRQRLLPRGSRRESIAKRIYGVGRNLYRAARARRPAIAAPAAAAREPEAPTLQPALPAALQQAVPDRDFVSPLRQYAVIVLPIIDHGFRFQRPQQLARRFAAAGHPVLYAALTFGDELQCREVADGIEELRLPGPPGVNPYQNVLDRTAAVRMAEALAGAIRQRGIGAAACLVQLPFWQPLAELLKERLNVPIVYDCMDDHAGFSTNHAPMLQAEQALMGAADLCVASSQVLFDKLAAASSRVVLVRNAVDYEHFCRVPARVPAAPVVVGYYGAIADWFDSPLVAGIAARRPDWRFVLVGSTFSADLAPFEGLANVEFTGELPYEALPEAIANWSCCIIPFRRNPLTEATNPVKVYEMLAAGKPVVAVPLPELELIAQDGGVALARTAEEFVARIEAEVAADGAQAVEARRAFAARHTWHDRFAALDRAIRDLYPLASVVVLTYNNVLLNRLCVGSILRDTDWPNLELIVVDNASTDGTRELLREFAERDARVRLVLNDENLGFSGGNNAGAAQARGEYLCLLNNDTVVTGAWLSTLVGHLRANGHLGLVGPVTNAIGNEAQIGVGYHDLAELPPWARAWCAAHRDELVDISMLAFFCVAMRRGVWASVGPLDDRFGKGMFEDDDYNRRVRAAGLQVKLARDAFVHHWQKASFRLLGEAEYQRVYHENRRKFRLKWNEAGAVPAAAAAKLAPLRSHAASSVATVVFPPSVGWSIDLFQRPHHLARVLAADGYTVVFDCSTSYDDVDVVKQIEPGLFLFRGECEWLADLPRLILWTFSYNFDYRDRFPESARVIYDWIDDLTVFPYDQEVLRALHRRALKEADVVASVARGLHEGALAARPDAIYLPNAVEEGRFEREPEPNPARSDRQLAKVLASGKPVAGYYGALAEWFDYPLLIETARLRPDWEFVLIGPDYDQSVGKARLSQCGNVTWLGPRKYHELPGYLHLFTVATIPFRINEITLATSPLKLYEYFAGGKPVIASPMPECAAYPEVHVVRSAAEFASALDAARAETQDPLRRARLGEIAAANTWRARVRTALTALADRRAEAAASAPDAAERIAQRFAHLKTAGNQRFFAAVARHLAALADDPCLPMYMEFALSSNARGRAVAAAMAQHVDLKGKRVLDIGCAYGGFLVAFAELGAEPVGFDINPALLGLARENFKDAGRPLEAFLKDITKEEDIAGLEGSFDLITCNDVIEHVADPRLTIEHIGRLLRAGGSAYFEIPNKDASAAVLSDGHYQMFGIVQLARDEAQAYFAEHSPDRPYDVGHYLTLDEYRQLFRSNGLTLEVLPATFEHASASAAQQALAEIARSAEARLLTVPDKARPGVREAIRRYLALAAADRDRLAGRDYLLRYGVGYWKVLARKVDSRAANRPSAAGPDEAAESESLVRQLRPAGAVAAP